MEDTKHILRTVQQTLEAISKLKTSDKFITHCRVNLPYCINSVRYKQGQYYFLNREYGLVGGSGLQEDKLRDLEPYDIFTLSDEAYNTYTDEGYLYTDATQPYRSIKDLENYRAKLQQVMRAAVPLTVSLVAP